MHSWGDTVCLHSPGGLLGEHHSSHCSWSSLWVTPFTSLPPPVLPATHSLLFPPFLFPCKNEMTAGVFEAEPTILHLSFVDGIYGSPKASKEIICIGKGQDSSTSCLLAPQLPLKLTPH